MVLVFAEHINGAFKKKAYESVQYASAIAQQMQSEVVAVVVGAISGDAAAQLGAYGANRVLVADDARLNSMNARAWSKAIIAAAKETHASVIVAPHDVTGKAIAPRVAARLQAGLVAGVVSYPDLSNGFEVRKGVFSGKAVANVRITSPIKVVTLMPNTFPVKKGEGSAASVSTLQVAFEPNDFAVTVKSINQVTGTVPLAEAELVVSGGRGLKGPENWGVLEHLADTLGAALACSRPVADSHWRPHHEHVGQTGGTIRPNLYIAVGISGAIQHLAGVNSSKTIVVINKDPEAPFFKAADYGVVGDALEVVPKLTAAVKKFKELQH